MGWGLTARPRVALGLRGRSRLAWGLSGGAGRGLTWRAYACWGLGRPACAPGSVAGGLMRRNCPGSGVDERARETVGLKGRARVA